MERVTDTEEIAGHGIHTFIDGREVYLGNAKLMDAQNIAYTENKTAGTVVYVACNNVFAGSIVISDTVKEGSKDAIRDMKQVGVKKTVMLTGDRQAAADAVAAELGIDEVHAELLPADKVGQVEKLLGAQNEKERLAFVGDGINDAPALTRADMGIAIGAGTDVAIDAADVVLMKSRLSDVPAAIRMSRATLRNIHENLFWAFFYNIIGIPLAAGVWYPLFGWKLNPMFGAAAMSLSSFCVVSNALRLNLFKMYDASKDKKLKAKKEKKRSKKEDKTMKKIMHIEGMMCGHCEAAVKKALEALPQVDEAVVSHEAGTAELTLNAEIADDVLKKTVEDKDYTVTSVE